MPFVPFFYGPGSPEKTVFPLIFFMARNLQLNIIEVEKSTESFLVYFSRREVNLEK